MTLTGSYKILCNEDETPMQGQVDGHLMTLLVDTLRDNQVVVATQEEVDELAAQGRFHG
jgi:hypothetical protein